MRMRKMGIICILIGAVMVAAATALLIYNKVDDETAGKASQKALSALQDQIAEDRPLQNDAEAELFPADTSNDDVELRPADTSKIEQTSAEMTTARIDGYDYIGFLTILAIDLELPVMSEWDDTRLRIAPCRQFGSLKTGDLVIAGHNYDEHFGRLHSLEYGDLLLFTDTEGQTTAYAVTKIETLQPTQVDEMKSGDWDITLYTCTYGGKRRVTVRFSKIDIESAEQLIENDPLT